MIFVAGVPSALAGPLTGITDSGSADAGSAGRSAQRLPATADGTTHRPPLGGREDILARRKLEPQISYEELAKTCQQRGLTAAEISTLAKLIYDLGLIIYYSDDEGLRNIVVLNPEGRLDT